MSMVVIFDLDGTLVDSCAICVDILSTMIEDRGMAHAIDGDHARGFMSLGGQRMVSTLLGPAARAPCADLAEFRDRYAQSVTAPETLFSGVEDGLRKLHALGCRLAICSNKPQNLCEKVLRDTGIAKYFEVVVGGRQNLRPKPAPDLLAATLDAMRCSADECLFVGDSELDDGAAKALAVPFAFVTYGYADKGWKYDGQASFDDFSGLCSMLLHDRASAMDTVRVL